METKKNIFIFLLFVIILAIVFMCYEYFRFVETIDTTLQVDPNAVAMVGNTQVMSNVPIQTVTQAPITTTIIPPSSSNYVANTPTIAGNTLIDPNSVMTPFVTPLNTTITTPTIMPVSSPVSTSIQPPIPSIASPVTTNINTLNAITPSTPNVVPPTSINVNNIQGSNNSSVKYDKDNINAKFHESAEDINAKLKMDGTSMDVSMNIRDLSGNIIPYTTTKPQGTVTFYQPGAYKFSASSYVPSYSDSVLLSRSSNLPMGVDITKETVMKKGFCDFYKVDPAKLEEKCNQLNPETCSSTDCCVLLGGSKCVNGNENGPISKAVYGDIRIPNKDYYYFRGKCYGNCPQ